MKISVIPDTGVELDETFLHQAFATFSYISTLTVLRQLVGGKTGASVLLVDIDSSADKSDEGGGRLGGQYVLKLDKMREWAGEAPEAERHSKAESWGATSRFAERHIPKLRHAFPTNDKIAMLYDVAGLSQLRLASYDQLGFGAQGKCCETLSNSLLLQLNGNYRIESGVSAKATLSDWLGYRLDSASAPRLHEYVKAQTLDKRAYTVGGKVLLNPLWFCNADVISHNSTHTRFLGLQHGDLHPGNIYFNRLNPVAQPFWIIDWALSRECPLLFDHSYLELALLLSGLEGKQPERLFALLEAADATDATVEGISVPSEHMSLFASLRALRGSLNKWQKENEEHRHDPFVHQMLLARVAAGLNWANKPIHERSRQLALAYAGKAATDFMRAFHPHTMDEAMDDADTARVPTRAPLSTEDVAPDVWNTCWDQVGRFREAEYAFVLIAGEVRDNADAASLGFLPWSAVIDLDPHSEVNGLYAAMAKVLQKRRSLTWFGKDALPVNFTRGTAWMMANGWPSRNEAIPASLETWRRSYLGKLRDLSELIGASTSPKPVKVVVLNNKSLSVQMLQRVVEAIDEKLGDNAEFILVGDAIDADIASLFTHILPVSIETFAKRLREIFGSAEETASARIPGISGAVEVSAEVLRNWEEDIETLHSNVLAKSSSEPDSPSQGTEDEKGSAFLRGMPPTWNELDAELDVVRDVNEELQRKLLDLLVKGRTATIELHHSPGAGGTTAALRAIWGMRGEHPVVVLRHYSRLTADRIDAVFQKSQMPVLLVAEASDLPATARDDLFREFGRRNTRVVMLYVVRTARKAGHTDVALFDPMSDNELGKFLGIYAPRCKHERNRRRLERIANPHDAGLMAYRSPFFFGLTTYDDEFLSIERYVSAHLQGIQPIARQTLLYLALVSRYSQKGLSEPLFRRLMQLSAGGTIVVEQTMGEHAARLIVRGNARLKIIHPLIAEEILRELLGGTKSEPDNWKFALKDLCIQLIREVVAVAGAYSDEAKELFIQLFISRDQWADNSRVGRLQFSPLIEAINSVDGQHQVLTVLTDLCGDEPHYWNHRGRHLIYNTNEDFGKAEEYLLKAVALSEEKDALHFHGLGMVRRFWVRDLLDRIVKEAHAEQRTLTPEGILSATRELTERALEAFTKARELNPDDDHGYITPIQTILLIVERICQAAGYDSVAPLCAKNNDVGRWLQEKLADAEDLLERVQHFRGTKRPTYHEKRCDYDLTAVYGDFDELIKTWEAVLDGTAEQAWLRKAMAHAYVARRNRLWSNLEGDELRQIVQLSERNLRFNPTSESDLRMWFQAFRWLPEFSFSEAIDRLLTWATRAESVDAHYYLYILHFLRWRAGGERDEELIQKHLQRSAQLAVGRRANSYEWLSTVPEWCPVINSRELGGWDDQKNFFRDTTKLAYAEGTISSLKRTAGSIRIGNTIRAFFVPPPHLRESEHINARVHFFLGFGYERMHAWATDLGPAPKQSKDATDQRIVEVPPARQHAPRSTAHISNDRTPARQSSRARESDILRQIHESVSKHLDHHRGTRKPLILATLGWQLSKEFPGQPPVHERVGFKSLRDLVLSLGDFVISGEHPRWVVEYRSPKPSADGQR